MFANNYCDKMYKKNTKSKTRKIQNMLLCRNHTHSFTECLINTNKTNLLKVYYLTEIIAIEYILYV